ncbi:hypothetical protein M5K25_022380 [Dendrobium thyrsiflorum]|uniref:Uncharacterized protein n=1 Tax=Dendrobium thyrsiflorum TaxID=117978 RepID=A0ABD0U615_DENTH
MLITVSAVSFYHNNNKKLGNLREAAYTKSDGHNFSSFIRGRTWRAMTLLPFGTSTDHVFPGRVTSTTSTAPPPATATHILPPPTAATTEPFRASVASATTCHLSSSHLYALTSPLTSSTTYISPCSAGGGAATGPVHPVSIPCGISSQTSFSISYTTPSFTAFPCTFTMQSFLLADTALMASRLNRPSRSGAIDSQRLDAEQQEGSHLSADRATSGR